MAVEFVIDASVAVKCFINEENSGLARDLASSDVTFSAPELIYVELASVAAKRVLRGDIPDEQAAQIVARIDDLLDQVFPIAPYAARAYALATTAGVSAYDGLYLALAEERSARVVTADMRLAQKAADAGLSRYVVALSSLPPS